MQHETSTFVQFQWSANIAHIAQISSIYLACNYLNNGFYMYSISNERFMKAMSLVRQWLDERQSCGFATIGNNKQGVTMDTDQAKHTHTHTLAQCSRTAATTTLSKR
jgi:hypothetical protein